MIRRRSELADVASNAADPLHVAVLIRHREDVAAQPPDPSVPRLLDPVLEAQSFAFARAIDGGQRSGTIVTQDQVSPLRQVVLRERLLTREPVDRLEAGADIFPLQRLRVSKPQDVERRLGKLTKQLVASGQHCPVRRRLPANEVILHDRSPFGGYGTRASHWHRAGGPRDSCAGSWH